jgi:acyl carrier protein
MISRINCEVFMDEVAFAVHRFIMREFLPGEDPNELTPETPLISGAILDSISTLKLVTFLEDQFRITIEAYEGSVQNLDTIRQIAAFVGEKRKIA